MNLLRKHIDSYETSGEAPITWGRFVERMLRHGSIALLLVFVSLLVGMSGYIGFEHLGVVDAFLNASMILGGMGPVNTVASTGGKIFAGFYALYSGLVFLVVAGLLLAPVVHRVLHKFHWETGEANDSGSNQ
ncbi:MAG TPA: hypothetical protein VFC35_04585 [Gemmatimonadaceae bacterium]|nr:hypothetical protein [Gemmatimonadaceae bacterium]